MAGSTMTEAALVRFEAQLRRERDELHAQLSQFEHSLSEVRESRSDGVSDDEHDPEGPTMSTEWSRLSGLEREAHERLGAIDHALSRITGGGYGVCVDCGGPIGAARLQARPDTERCIDCARLAEACR
ncbi:TraR/DksA family transcriptional regulator [Plantibacter sp. YIM 135347]|uniref:TraR/DksA family transcriptional regulator n=1 Tax=Plantibacter sp. YIM 135347 TaxID=3423919 RepID=UPI003D34DA56